MEHTLTHSSIALHRLLFHARHGVMEQERLTGADFTVDVTVDIDLAAAMTTDDVAQTLDYSELYRLVAREMEQPSCLIENVAYRIAAGVLKRWPQATAADVAVTKLNPPMGAATDGATVRICLKNQ